MTDENLENEALETEALTVEQPETVDNLDSTPDDDTTEGDTPEKPKQSGVQKRINELVSEREDWKRQAQYFAEIAKTKETPQAETKAAETPTVAPKADDFDTYEEFIAANTTHEVQKALAAQAETNKQTDADNRKTEAQQSQQQAMQARISEGREKYDDFNAVALGNHWRPSQEMVMAIGDSDVGADLAYYLGSNPDEAAAIVEMNPISAMRAMGRLEAKLEANPVQTAEKSNAPSPIRPVSKTTQVANDPEKMSVDEWMKWRRKQVS